MIGPTPVRNADYSKAVSKVAHNFSNSKYSSFDFQISATNIKGFSEREWFRLPPELQNQLHVVVSSKRFPFRTVNELCRWCAVIGLKVLEELEPDMPSISRQCDLINELAINEQRRIELEAIFVKVNELVSDHMSTGRPNEAKQYLAQVVEMIHQMPEGLWRTRYVERFTRQFAAYLRRDDTANFLDVGLPTATIEERIMRALNPMAPHEVEAQHQRDIESGEIEVQGDDDDE